MGIATARGGTAWDAHRSIPPPGSSEKGEGRCGRSLDASSPSQRPLPSTEKRTFAYLTVHVEAQHPKHLPRCRGIHSIMRKPYQARGAKRPSWRYYGEYGSFNLQEHAKAEACMMWLKRPGLMKLTVTQYEYSL